MNGYGNYGLDKRPNEGVTDKTPEWLEDFFTTNHVKQEVKLNEIDDLIINPQYVKTRKCINCGTILSDNEISKCSKCQNI